MHARTHLNKFHLRLFFSKCLLLILSSFLEFLDGLAGMIFWPLLGLWVKLFFLGGGEGGWEIIDYY